MKFSKKKIAKGQTLDPNSNLYLEVQLFKKKKKKESQMPDTDQRVRSPLKRAGRASENCEIDAASSPPAVFSEQKELSRENFEDIKALLQSKNAITLT